MAEKKSHAVGLHAIPHDGGMRERLYALESGQNAHEGNCRKSAADVVARMVENFAERTCGKILSSNSESIPILFCMFQHGTMAVV
jgi:hypothetical protein